MVRVGVVLACWLLFARVFVQLHTWTVDDAYITFRYAENWAAGEGPVYNPGEWVEGYTSVAWLALLTIAHALGAPTELASKALGAAAMATIPAVLASADRIAPVPPRAAGAAALIAGTSGALLAWAGGGLEVTASALVAASR